MPTSLLIFAIGGIVACIVGFFITFFHPALAYRIRRMPHASLESPEFACMAALVGDAELHHDTKVDALTNGETFYEAELEAIRGARFTVCLEAYIFQKGEVAHKFIEAMTERAGAGVEVRIVLDAIGSFNTWRRTFRELIAAGGEVHWYNPFRWYSLPRFNNRTHRELLIVDSRVGFLGGAGIADHWWKSRGKKNPRWRDSMFRVEGSAVSSMMSMFAENWLEASGELLAAPEYFPRIPSSGKMVSMVVDSAPTAGRGTRARMLFQTLIASAKESIHLTTPYFLPDKGATEELVKAIKERGVEVSILVPGKHNDHLLTRRSSRRLYGELLRAGARVYEYRPSMIHAKTLVIDGLWSVVGSTNFDQRSFGINDEANLAVQDEAFAARVEEDFRRDLAQSHSVTYREWRRRPVLERLHELLGWVLERQE